ncbi:cupin domain-containing protein [bacterium]|nr:cupin domain-containing protein [bacterium]
MTNEFSSSPVRPSEVQSLIDRFRLLPHPEGGFYREVFRSTRQVKRLSSGSGGASLDFSNRESDTVRAALTDIYFLLEKGDFSRFHRVESDEAWHHLGGGPLQLVLISPDLTEQTTLILEPATVGEAICVVPANWWQAAIPLSTYALSSCSVGPGFDFKDFELAQDVPLGEQIKRAHPELAHLV